MVSCTLSDVVVGLKAVVVSLPPIVVPTTIPAVGAAVAVVFEGAQVDEPRCLVLGG